MQSKHFAIYHNVYWRRQLELHSLGGAPFRQCVFNMRAIIKCWQVTNQANSSNRSPANKFDQAVIDFRLGRDHHRAPSKLAVAESQKEAGTAIDLFFSVHTQRKRPPSEPRQTDKNGRLISQLSPPAKIAGAQRCHVGGESYA